MKKERSIKIHFVDFWPTFEPEGFFIYDFLSEKYQLIIDEENPDYLVFSCFGNNHLYYNDCVRIYYDSENLFPNFNLCDYAFGFPHLQLGDRFLRIPEWVYHTRHFLYSKSLKDEAALLNRKFCNFVYSNDRIDVDPFRVQFFKRLSEYKQVDSGGMVENNIGYCVADKRSFISNYKFTIAFENSRADGYTTEKMIDPMLVNSMPVYWGNPSVHLDFNTDAIVHVKDYDAMDDAIAEIIALDNDDAAYLEKLRKPWFLNENFKDWKKKVGDFLDRILEQSKETAIRKAIYGRNFYYRQAF